MCCGVAAIVFSDSAAAAYLTSINGYTYTFLFFLNAATETGVEGEPALPAFFCDVIMSATSVGRVCSARAPLEVPKERQKQDTFNHSTKPR